ncbi:MAG: hypothetical protein R3E11_03915 [Sphingobium sp.]|nr:hypothetical protein [Sphingomonas sp.]
METISRLIAEHEAMDDMASSLMELARSPVPLADEAFALMRRLAGCLDEHLAAEAGFLYANHYRAQPNRLEEEVIAFERDFQNLQEEWELYMSEWTVDNMSIDWRNFDHATQSVMQRFCARLMQENEILYPLALHYGRIRLREEGWEPDIFNNNGANI